MGSFIAGVVLLLLAATPSVQGQGHISFNNRVTSVGLVAPIYGVNPNCLGTRLRGNATTNGGSTDYTGWPLLFGTQFTAELWAETSPSSGIFQPLTGAQAKVPFRTTASLGGFIQNSSTPVLVPSVPGPADGSSRFQVRAWNNVGGQATTYAQALSMNQGIGVSDVFTSPVIAAPNQPGYIVGFTSFNLTVAAACVPEPSMVLLGALAGVALLWRRKTVSN